MAASTSDIKLLTRLFLASFGVTSFMTACWRNSHDDRAAAGKHRLNTKIAFRQMSHASKREPVSKSRPSWMMAWYVFVLVTPSFARSSQITTTWGCRVSCLAARAAVLSSMYCCRFSPGYVTQNHFNVVRVTSLYILEKLHTSHNQLEMSPTTSAL